MSTPAYKKAARQKEHAKQKQLKKYAALFGTPSKKSKKEFKPYEPPTVFRRETPMYGSLTTSDSIPGNGTARVESKQYTGDYIVGIATMHKSNLVPVGRGDNPVDYATMRRN